MTCGSIRFDKDGAYFDKHEIAVLDVGFDWAAWLTNAGLLSLDSSVWSAEPGVSISAPQEADGVTSVLVSGGAPASEYVLTNTITAGALVDVRTMRIKVR